MKGKQLVYRPDIDGLRAMAVLLVLLFHFDLGVSGGFIGVDVFFVISGYLITEVIRNGTRAGKFTFHDFYIRRLLRLHPALLVTVAVTLGAGFLLMDPASFADLAASAKYATLSASNFYFWMNQNYFDASAQTKPLLHTWSLAAEWQFYLIWPFIVWGAMKVSNRILPTLLAVLTVASLLASQWMLGRDSSAAYFMMPFRVFELSIGALLVYVPTTHMSPRIDSAITIAGIIAIITAAFSLTAESVFPGVAAILPCLGAAACIYAGNSPAGGLLRIKPIVFIGITSYSVYLVHWPLLTLYKYYVFREISQPEKITLLLVAIVLGIALYYSVEKLFMGRRKLLKPIGIAIIVSVGALAIYACNIVIDSEGMKTRIPDEQLSFTRDPKSYHIHNYGGHGYNLNSKIGDISGQEAAIFAGDSFALQYAFGLDNTFRGTGFYVQGHFQHGCLISKSYVRLVNNVPVKGCKETNDALTESLSGNKYPLIVAQHWNGYRGQIQHNGGPTTTSIDDQSYRSILFGVLEELKSTAGDRDLLIVGSQPIGNGGAPGECLLRPIFLDQPCEKQLSFRVESSKSEFTNNILREFAERTPRTYFIDPAKAICKESDCLTFDSGKILYSDSVHLSKDGSLKAAGWLSTEIRKLAKH